MEIPPQSREGSLEPGVEGRFNRLMKVLGMMLIGGLQGILGNIG